MPEFLEMKAQDVFGKSQTTRVLMTFTAFRVILLGDPKRLKSK